MKLSVLSAALALFLSPLSAVAQRDFDSVDIEVIKVAGNVYMLVGAGGNIGVSVGESGILIVDDQFAPLAGKIREAVSGIASGELEFVLNTHWHGDHTGGNVEFGKEAHIIAHSNVRRRLATEQTVRGRVTPPSPEVALPVITFDDSLSIHFNGEQIKMVHAPSAHTDGDSIIYFTGSNVIHMGDNFFSGRFPFVDLETGGDVEGLAASVAKVIDTLPPGVKIIPGHGPLSTAKDLQLFHRMLEDTTASVRQGMESGKSLSEIKETGLSEEWKDWGAGFLDTGTWIEIVYRSLSRGEG
jgi:cyclase